MKERIFNNITWRGMGEVLKWAIKREKFPENTVHIILQCLAQIHLYTRKYKYSDFCQDVKGYVWQSYF